MHVPPGGYSIGIETDPWLFTAGFTATDSGQCCIPTRADLTVAVSA